MTPKEIFLSCVQGKKCERPAAGSATSVITTDLMEHTGLFFPEAHHNPEIMAGLAAAGHTILGFDNVMPLFSVWHESEALGCNVEWGNKGLMPACRNALLNNIHVLPEIPSDLLERPGCAVPLKALALLRKEFTNKISITGKVFGPWTLAYHVYGVENFLMSTMIDPDAVRTALHHLINITLTFARAQIKAGADSITLADHCTRDLCSPDAYHDFLLPIHKSLKNELNCPIILHICGDTSDRIPFIAETGIDCFHFDSKVPTKKARELSGGHIALMGGTPNLTTVMSGTPEQIEMDVREKIKIGINVLGPECAVPLNAPYRNLAYFTETVKRFSSL
jgi:MtaA/CmuA family methyltransferase